MKTFFALLTFGLIASMSLPAFGDFPIRQSSNKEVDHVVVYNSTDNEYLVVWGEWIPVGNLYLLGPVMGQRVSFRGSKLGAPFQIFDMAGSPSVAYNSKANEYLVVAVSVNLLGQRIKNDGKKIGGSVQLMTNAGYPRILYNELTNEYFLAAYSFDTTPHRIQVRRIDPELQKLHPIKDVSVWNDSTYCLTYAPIAPNGQYLLSWWPEGHRLLDWEGNLIKSIKLETGYPAGGYADGEGYSGYSADFVQSAFGYKDGNPVFMVVWDEMNNKWPWPEVPGVTALLCGVWGAYIDAANPPGNVTNTFFPVTDIQLIRWCSARWKPKVVYNKVAQKFMVAWNETPTDAATNDAKVNHIRATTEFKNVTGFANVVLSATNGTEDPDYPAIAASTTGASALVVWQDKRNVSSTDIDLYGNIFTATPVNNTQTGTNVQVNLGSGVTVTFDNVTGTGNTTLTTSNSGPPPPGGFAIMPSGSPTYYSITTTATYSGMIALEIAYSDSGLGPDLESLLKLKTYSESTEEWIDITEGVNIGLNLIHGKTDHLSIFAIMSSSSSGGVTLVTNCDDSGPGSLRAAIESANSNVGPDTINFAIPKGVPGHDTIDGVWRIFPQSQLPTITDGGLVINGFSQAAFIGEDSNPLGPEIVINGENAGQYVSGLLIMAPGVTIMGLTINNFYSIGIWLDHVDGGQIRGCYIGTDFTGSGPAPNGYGVWIGNKSHHIVVAPVDTFRNVISGNTNGGIFVSDTSRHVHIIGNIIGLNRQASAPLGNYCGICIRRQCDSVVVFDNWISGNKYGINISESSRNTIENNRIGMVPEHLFPETGNEFDGVYIAGQSFENQIRNNFIWFNKGDGVRIYGPEPFRNRISHNSIAHNEKSGILYDSGGANVLPQPVITNVTSTSVFGTAVPNANIEIYTDSENEGELFQGETMSGPSGNFTWTGMIQGSFPNVTAIAIDAEGNTSCFSTPMATDVEQRTLNITPKSFSLAQNHPNPFNPRTSIEYDLPYACLVMVEIFNTKGQRISLLSSKIQAPGHATVVWDGRDEQGQNIGSGVYFYRVTALSLDNTEKTRQIQFQQTKKMLLVK